MAFPPRRTNATSRDARQTPARRLGIALAATIAAVAAACVPASADPGGEGRPGPDAPAPGPARLVTPTTTTTLPPLPRPRGIRVQQGDSWAETGCPMFPEDNYWHADVRGLPTLAPRSPDGRDLGDFPVEATPDPLRVVSGLTADAAKTITWASASDPQEWVRSEGNWTSASEFTAVELRTLGPLTSAEAGLLRHRVPDEVLVELSSTDDHALFVDTDACSLIEYIGWDRTPGERTGRNATVNDLRTNERRLSVRPGWLGDAHNGPGKVIDSPYSWVHPRTPGLDGTEFHEPRAAKTASGGSGLPTSAGMVRLDEVFESPDPSSQVVADDARIDHAIAVTLPQRHISSMPQVISRGMPSPFSWPATTTDGCGGSECFDGSTGSDFHVPMGSRLRLGEEACSREWSEPQAAVVVEAMCNHGIVVTDSSAHVKLAIERSDSGAGSKWRREAQKQLDTLSLRDFELVDVSGIAAVDPHALWEVARNWAVDRYGDGSTPASGWYQGSFWATVNTCGRPGHDPMGTTRPTCTDPFLARVDRAVNGPDWFAVR